MDVCLEAAHFEFYRQPHRLAGWSWGDAMRPSTAERRGGRGVPDLEMARKSEETSPVSSPGSPRDHGWRGRRLNTIVSRVMLGVMVLFLLGLIPELLPHGNLAARRKEVIKKYQHIQDDSEDVHVAEDAPPTVQEDAVHVDNDGRGSSKEKEHSSTTVDEDLVRVGVETEGAKERQPESTSPEDQDLVRVGVDTEDAKERQPDSTTEADQDLVRVGVEMEGAKERQPNNERTEADQDLVSVGVEAEHSKEESQPVSTSETTEEISKTDPEAVGNGVGEVREPAGSPGSREVAQESPVASQESPVASQESPVASQESPVASQESPAQQTAALDDGSLGFTAVQELPTRPPSYVEPIPTEAPGGQAADLPSAREAPSTAAPAGEVRGEVRMEGGSPVAETSERPAATAEIPKQAAEVHMESGEVASTTAPSKETSAKQAGDSGAEVRVEAASPVAETSERPAATAEIPKQASDVHVESGDVASTTAPSKETSAKQAGDSGAEVRASDVHVESGDVASTTAPLKEISAKQAADGGEVLVEGGLSTQSTQQGLPPQASDIQVDSKDSESAGKDTGFLQRVETAAVKAGEGLLRKASTEGTSAIKKVAQEAVEEAAELGKVLKTAAEKTGEALAEEVIAVKQSVS
eukprot:s731_g9.t1